MERSKTSVPFGARPSLLQSIDLALPQCHACQPWVCHEVEHSCRAATSTLSFTNALPELGSHSVMCDSRDAPQSTIHVSLPLPGDPMSPIPQGGSCQGSIRLGYADTLFLDRRSARAAPSLSIAGHLFVGVRAPALASRLGLALLLASPMAAGRIALRRLLVILPAWLAFFAPAGHMFGSLLVIRFAVRVGVRGRGGGGGGVRRGLAHGPRPVIDAAD